MRRDYSADDIELDKIAHKILEEYLNGGLSDATERKILEWLGDSEGRQRKSDALSKAWHRHVRYNPYPGKKAYEMYENLARRLDLPVKDIKFIERRKAGRWWMHAAAIWALLLALGWVLNERFATGISDTPVMELHNAQPAVKQAMKGNVRSVSAKSGERVSVQLPDGTYVLLDDDTNLVYNDNQVFVAGDAFFMAPKDREMPLEVNTNGVSVTVVGTTFAVSAWDGASHEVSLYSGRVDVRAGDSFYRLRPHKRLLYNCLTGDVAISSIENEVPDWVARKLLFEESPMSEIFSVMVWFYNTSFCIEGEPDLWQRFTFTMSGNETVGELLDMMIRAGGEFSYRIEGDVIYIND